MQTTTLRLTPKALLLAFVSACYPLAGFAAAAGKVEFSVGNVTAVGSDGRSRSLVKGEEINVGDTIQTGDGRAQVRFTDGGFISLTPKTEFKVNDYNYSGKTDGTEKGFFGLVKGGLRAITGAIGHVNKKTYLVNTPVATIGIRGTEFLATMDEKLLVKVGDGAVYISNDNGDIVLYKGQSGEVGGIGEKPLYTNDEPLVTAAGPTGGTPNDLYEDQQLQQPDQISYVTGQDTTSTGVSCALVGGCVTSSASNMDFVVANNLYAEYTAPSVRGTIDVSFGSGRIDVFSLTDGSASVSTSGSITGNTFAVNGTGTIAPSTSSAFTASGSFVGTNAAQAGVTYSFAGGPSGSVLFTQTQLQSGCFYC